MWYNSDSVVKVFCHGSALILSVTGGIFVMKRFTSILCALCLVIGLLAGLTFAPAAKAQADGPESPGEVTVVIFSDKNAASDWNSLAEIKTVSGPAITAGGTAFEVGGKTQWNHGMIIIDAQNGWTFKKATYASDKELTSETLAAAISDVTTNSGNEIPDDVRTLLNSYSSEDKNRIDAIYINRALYKQINYDSVIIEFEKNGTTLTTEVDVKSDEYCDSDGLSVKVGDEFDIFEVDKVKDKVFAGGYTRSDYSIDTYGIDATPSNALEKLYGSENDEDFGLFKATISGINSIELINKKNGLSYEFWVLMTDDSMPLKMNDFVLPDTVRIENNTDPSDTGKYTIYSKEKDFLTELTMNFSVPDGCEIEEIRFAGEKVEGSEPIFVETGREDYVFYASAVCKKEGSNVTITVKSENDTVALCDFLRVILSKNGNNYVYNFDIDYTRWMGGQGKQLLPVAVGSTLKLMDFIHLFDDKDQQKLFDGITNGTYIVNMQGVKPAFENGVFKGNLIVYYPCERMYLWDTSSSTVLYSGSADIQVKASTLIECGSSVDLSQLLNGYWDDGCEVFDKDDLGYTLKDKVFTAPNTISGIYEYVVYVNMAEIKVIVCPAGTLMSSLTDVAKTVEKDESLVVDINADNVSLSKDTINNFKNNGGDNSSIVIKNKKNSHTPEWHINKNDLTDEAQNDIKLDVAVGSELVNSTLDNAMTRNNIKGLKLGFAANGKLPGKTGVRFYPSDEELKQIENINNIQLYYLNNTTGKLEREDRSLYAGKDSSGKYYIDVTVTHNSDFVLSSLDAESVTVISNNPSGSGSTTGGGSSSGGAIYTGGGSSTSGTASTSDTTAKDTTAVDAEKASESSGTGSKTNDEKKDEDTTIVENEDGSVTTSTVTEKGGNKVEKSTTEFPDGSQRQSEITTSKSGQVEVLDSKIDADGLVESVSQEITKPDGTKVTKKFVASYNNAVKLTNYDTPQGEAKVPSTLIVNGKKVKVDTIGKEAFAGNKELTKVTLGKYIETIGKNAFKGCSNLKTITINSGKITKISKGAFKGIASNAVIRIKATKKKFDKIVSLIKASGIDKGVTFVRIE